MGIVEEGYGGRVGYTDRTIMYGWALDALMSMGMAEGDVVVDVGAGYCDFDMYLRQRGWFGRYLPVDPSIDHSVELEYWFPPFMAHWFVCLDTLEHLHNWGEMLDRMKVCATKGVVVSTADGDTIDVLGMHPSHVTSIRADDLSRHGLHVVSNDLGAYRQLVGWRSAVEGR